MRFKVPIIVLVLLVLVVSAAGAQGDYFVVNQSTNLAHDEAQAVYFTNLARSDNGLPPLRWNKELTDSARWYAWDKSVNPPAPGCDSYHQDSNCTYPDERAEIFGYPGSAGAENAWLSYVPPQAAVDGWMGSGGHQANILGVDHREIGLGYSNTNDGWVAQEFGRDPFYPPVIINHEALNTTNRQVDLYIYDREDAGGFAALRPAVAMQVSENQCFINSSWQPFNTRLSYTLSPQNGWKQVFVRTRDAYGHTMTVEDSIYYGSDPPLDGINSAKMSSAEPQVNLYGLDSGGRSHVQFSLGWVADQFKDLSNNLLPQVSDSAALNGRAVVLSPQNGLGSTWAWTTTFHSNIPMVAYFRLKVDNNSSASTVATLRVKPGSNPEVSLPLTGSSFPAASQYREVAVPFTHTPTAQHPFLIFRVDRNADLAVSVDTVTIFTAPQPYTGASMTWAVPGGSYRGQGVWVRYSQADGSNFTAFTQHPKDVPAYTSLVFFYERSTGQKTPSRYILPVEPNCWPGFNYSLAEPASWSNISFQADSLSVDVNPDQLPNGQYQTTLTLSSASPEILQVQVPVRLIVADVIPRVFLPAIHK